jgi:hypothetical protein
MPFAAGCLFSVRILNINLYDNVTVYAHETTFLPQLVGPFAIAVGRFCARRTQAIAGKAQ